jgi:toluene monooxygenase system protein E
MTRRRTYWHLSDLGRRPSEYDIATSRLHYWAGRGFEVKVPLDEWYARHQRGSPLRCTDWEQFRDPRETTYTTYTAIQHARETFVDGLLESIDDGYDRRLSPAWLAVLDRVLAPLRYPVHGLQMAAAYVGHMAPASRVTIAAAFQAADEVRRVQRLAYRMRQLQETHPAFGHAARTTWQDDPIWQPLREVLETLLVTWDWGESLVALQLVLKPAFDELFMTHLGRLARAAGDDVLERMFFSLNEDCRWHRAWSAALVLTAVRDTPESVGQIETWIERWTPRASRAIAAFAPVFEDMARLAPLPTFAAVTGDIERARSQHCASALGREGPRVPIQTSRT